MIIKALSLWEPWASLMRCGAKRIETRSWATGYRGPLLICAARHWDNVCHSCLHSPVFQSGLAPLVGGALDMTRPPPREVFAQHLLRGQAVAVVDLVDCRNTFAIEHPNMAAEVFFGDFSDGRYGWITENVRAIEPFPVRGRQGLFEVEVPEAIAKAVRRAIES